MTTALLIHGFLDDASVWDGVVAALAGTVATVRYELPGFGARTDAVADPREVSLASLAAEAGAIIDGLDQDVIVVGHSLGSQIAQLVAADRPGKVVGLVLLTPIPLGGTQLPDAALAPFRALGGDYAAQRAARAQLSPALTDDQLDRLTRTGLPARPGVVAHYVDVWNAGTAHTAPQNGFTGPVLVIRGGADAFVTEEVAAAVTSRFPQAREEVIDHGGHWAHVECPGHMAALIGSFASGVTASAWRRGFAQQSQAAFAEAFAEDVVLDATTLWEPIRGRDNVAAVMVTASSIYETLEFTAEATDGSTSYLQWRATAFGGKNIRGITILERGPDGRVTSAAIHHRPLSAVLPFATEIRNRLGGVIPARHLIQETA